jgi:hypothetical protein
MGGFGQTFSVMTVLESLSSPSTGKYGQNRKINSTIFIFLTTYRLVMSLRQECLLTGSEPVLRCYRIFNHKEVDALSTAAGETLPTTVQGRVVN